MRTLPRLRIGLNYLTNGQVLYVFTTLRLQLIYPRYLDSEVIGRSYLMFTYSPSIPAYGSKRETHGDVSVSKRCG